jgi:hypothetical protein
MGGEISRAHALEGRHRDHGQLFEQKASSKLKAFAQNCQAVGPDKLNDEDLIAYMTRCRRHHAEMISQHMRYTAGAVVMLGSRRPNYSA